MTIDEANELIERAKKYLNQTITVSDGKNTIISTFTRICPIVGTGEGKRMRYTIDGILKGEDKKERSLPLQHIIKSFEKDNRE